MENKKTKKTLSEIERRRNEYRRLMQAQIIATVETQSLDDLEKTKSFRVHSPDQKTPHDEIVVDDKNINGQTIPTPTRAWWSDYDSINLTINRAAQNHAEVRGRLEWCGTLLRAQSIEIWKKDCLIARFEGRTPPQEPSPIKLTGFDFEDLDETNPGDYLLTQKHYIEKLFKTLFDRVLMVGLGFGLFIVFVIIWAASRH